MLIDLKNIDIWQNNECLIKNMSLQVDEGEFIYIIGNVGTGKSSILKTLYAELPINKKENEETNIANILNYDLINIKHKNIPSLRKKLGIIFQDFQLLNDRTINKNLDFVLKATKWKKKDRKTRIQEVLEVVGMQHKKDNLPYELSGGEQQRIAIARALLNHPKIILADEPTGNLDSNTSYEIIEMLKNIASKGTTVIIITHNLNLLHRYPGVVYQISHQKFTELNKQDLNNIKIENK